jgi:hypothetical protein
MSGILDGLAADIASALNGQLYTGTLRKTTVTGRDEYGDATTTTADYAVQGFQSAYSALVIAAGGIPATDIKLVLIAGLCEAPPAIQDKVQMQGEWFQIRNVSRDAALATYECQAFRVPS